MFGDDMANTYEADGESFAPDGSYAMALKAGDWNIQVDNDNPGPGELSIAGHRYLHHRRPGAGGGFCGAILRGGADHDHEPAGRARSAVNYDQTHQRRLDAAGRSQGRWSRDRRVGRRRPRTPEISPARRMCPTNNVIVHVVDGNNHATNQTLSLVITGVAAPLEVDTFLDIERDERRAI